MSSTANTNSQTVSSATLSKLNATTAEESTTTHGLEPEPHGFGAEISSATMMSNSQECYNDMQYSGAEVERGYGHFFIKKTFHRPTYCHHCTDMLWGLIGQGYVCEVCNFVVHDRCLRTVVSPCSSIASNLIKNPVAHCWSEVGQFKRKFCNLCRKRLEDLPAIRCEICEYYGHVDCQDFAVSDCKECATYVPNKDQMSVVQYHHWREGNLSGNSKCFHCKKTCWSAECLTGMRCEWCGVSAHATCYKQLPSECSFGCLRNIMLPPYSVTVPRIDVPQEMLFGFPKKNQPDENVNVEFKPEEEQDKRSPKETKDKEKEEEIVQLYDGNNSLKRKQHRLTSVPKQAPAQILLEAALRTFHISEDPINFSISEAPENDTVEKVLDLSQPLCNQVSTKQQGKKTAIVLRYREQDPTKGYIRIYPKGLSDISPKADVTFKHIPVEEKNNAQELISLALQKFGMENANPNEFSLVEVVLNKGVSERELQNNDRPFLIMQKSRKECLRQSRMTRYYIKQKDDPHGPHIAMYVGNLPVNLSQRQYEHILLDSIGKENKWSNFDVIYYEYGSLVLVYNNAEKATKTYKILQESSFDDKQFIVLLLPNIQPYMIPASTVPLLVLVNVKSGGQQGMELIRSFRKLLNPHQVYDLMNGGPLPGLYVFRNLTKFKILVCGGDGSVGWALSCLDNVGQDALCQSPPMAVIPLGTGNDMARVLRWGSGYTGTEDPLSLLRDVIEADDIKLDRWTVIFHPNEKDVDDVKAAIANDTNTAQLNEDPTSIFVMNNYFGIGIDADLCLDFHMAREENPDKFNSRLHNKSMYLKIGLRKIINKRSCKDLHKAIRLEVDGKLIDVPAVEGVIILNILSWASGANLWGPEKEDQFAKPTHYDGMLEVVGLTGVVHMGQIQSGLRSAIRIAQGGHIRIQLLADLPVQVDGEPWIQPAGQVVVLRSALKATMLKKSKNKMKRCNTEPNIYFPLESGTAAGGTISSGVGGGQTSPSASSHIPFPSSNNNGGINPIMGMGANNSMYGCSGINMPCCSGGNHQANSDLSSACGGAEFFNLSLTSASTCKVSIPSAISDCLVGLPLDYNNIALLDDREISITNLPASFDKLILHDKHNITISDPTLKTNKKLNNIIFEEIQINSANNRISTHEGNNNKESFSLSKISYPITVITSSSNQSFTNSSINSSQRNYEHQQAVTTKSSDSSKSEGKSPAR